MNNLWFSLTQTHLTPEMKGVFIVLGLIAVVSLSLAAWKYLQQPTKSSTPSRPTSKKTKKKRSKSK